MYYYLKIITHYFNNYYNNITCKYTSCSMALISIIDIFFFGKKKFKKFLFPSGARLQILKEQLQAKMRVKRAENRKIQESQQKLDNEEISEEEEEEMTDEEEGNRINIMCLFLIPCTYIICASLDCPRDSI